MRENTSTTTEANRAPELLRRATTLAALSVVAVLALGSSPAHAAAAQPAAPACATVCLTAPQSAALKVLNADRTGAGVKALTPQAQLQAKAQAWAEHLAHDDRLSHSTLTSGVPSCFRTLGENVGYGPSVQAIEQQYLASPHHRINVFNGNFTQVGIGVATNVHHTFTVQVFMGGCS